MEKGAMSHLGNWHDRGSLFGGDGNELYRETAAKSSIGHLLIEEKDRWFVRREKEKDGVISSRGTTLICSEGSACSRDGGMQGAGRPQE